MCPDKARRVGAAARCRPVLARVGVALGALACAATESSERVVAKLAGGVIARVGSIELTAGSVGRVAAAQHLSVDEALQRLSEDARFAAQAQREGPPGVVRNVERTVLARLVLESLRTEAKAKGDPSEAEAAEHIARRWWDVDRPAAARTVHAVIRVRSDTDRARARALGPLLRERLQGISDGAKFVEAAKAFDAGGLEVVAESLPAVAIDGTVVPTEAPEPGARQRRLVPEFAKAANALTTPGALSPVVETSFGFHVILLIERTSARILPFDDKRRAVAGDVVTARAAKEQEALLRRLRDGTYVDVGRAAVHIAGQVKVTP